ncbi:MAG: ribosome-associated translation inhibitor RaiA [candidate division WOR-3 bacterium]|nr:MAG: ribosome-associated translation inhibitor RaiA [candidate division WOR-3 bacterium]
MELIITARNFALSDALQQYARKKMSKLKRFAHDIIDSNLVLEKDKSVSIIELTLSVRHSFITSKVKNPDIYQGINDAFKKIERQLNKYEAKFRERKRLARKTRRV